MTTLYWYWTTNPQKVRLVLEEWNIEHELIKIHLGKREHRTDDYRLIHPKQSVPTLIFNGYTYWESNSALLALANAYPSLIPPANSSEYAQALNLLFLEASSFQRWAGVHFMEKKIHPIIGKPTSEINILQAHKRLISSLAILETQIGTKNQLFQEFTIVDCAFAPWLPYLDLSEHPNIHRWLSSMRLKRCWKVCGFRD